MAASMAARFWRRSFRNVVKCAVIAGEGCQFNARNYARGSWRGLQDVKTSGEDKSRWRDELKSKNPRKNPYVTFEGQDPVHKSMANNTWDGSGNAKVTKSPQSSKKRSSNQRVQETQQKTRSTRSLQSYEKLDEGDKRFGQAILSAKSRKEREKNRVILLEGFRLIQDAIDSGATAKCIYFSDQDLLDRLRLVDDVPLYKVQYRHFKIWSDTQTPAGIMALFEKPKKGECPSPIESCLPLTLICDNVRDPGNMGTLIRTAAAVGCQRILTTKGCVDVWEPKVLRAGMGSHFHIPVLPGIPWELLLNYIEDQTQVLIAETGRQDSAKTELSKLLSDEAGELSTETFDISGLDHKKQKLYKEKYSDFISESMSDLSVDKAFLDKDHVKQFGRVPLHCVSYDKVKISDSQVALVIGGETTGVSSTAKKFAFDRFGECVTLPMSQVVNSLNSAIAASVILYEIRKHMISKQH